MRILNVIIVGVETFNLSVIIVVVSRKIIKNLSKCKLLAPPNMIGNTIKSKVLFTLDNLSRTELCDKKANAEHQVIRSFCADQTIKCKHCLILVHKNTYLRIGCWLVQPYPKSIAQSANRSIPILLKRHEIIDQSHIRFSQIHFYITHEDGAICLYIAKNGYSGPYSDANIPY